MVKIVPLAQHEARVGVVIRKVLPKELDAIAMPGFASTVDEPVGVPVEYDDVEEGRRKIA